MGYVIIGIIIVIILLVYIFWNEREDESAIRNEPYIIKQQEEHAKLIESQYKEKIGKDPFYDVNYVKEVPTHFMQGFINHIDSPAVSNDNKWVSGTEPFITEGDYFEKANPSMSSYYIATDDIYLIDNGVIITKGQAILSLIEGIRRYKRRHEVIDRKSEYPLTPTEAYKVVEEIADKVLPTNEKDEAEDYFKNFVITGDKIVKRPSKKE